MLTQRIITQIIANFEHPKTFH